MHPFAGTLRVGPSGHEKAVPAAVGVLDRGLGTEEVAPGAESAVVIDEPSPLFGGHSFSLYIASSHVMVGLALNEPLSAADVDGDEVGIALAPGIEFHIGGVGGLEAEPPLNLGITVEDLC